MKVRITYTVTVDDGYRRAVNMHYGREGLATRAQIVEWHKQFGESQDDNLAWSIGESYE